MALGRQQLGIGRPRLRAVAGDRRAPATARRIGASMAPALAGLVLALDWQPTPSTQVLPTTVAQALAICGRTFAEVWRFDAASGNVAGSGSNPWVPLNPPRYSMTFPVWDGSSMTATKAVEWMGVATTRYLTFLSAAAYDLTQSLCWVWYGRLLRPPGGDRAWFGKRATSAAAGYEVRITSGRPQLRVSDGTTHATAEPPDDGTQDGDGFCDGSPQWWAFKINTTNNTAQVLGYRAAGTPVAIASGSKSSAAAVRFGGLGSYLFDCELLQVAWCGVLVGAEAEAFDLTALNALDTTARPPAELGRYDRQSSMAVRVADVAGHGDLVQHLHGSAVTTALCHFPHQYHSSASSPGKLAPFFGTRGVTTSADGGAQKRNLFTRSDEFDHADWTKVNLTPTKNAGVNPSSFTGATLLTATAANARIYQVKAVTSNKAHYHSIWLRRGGGSDVAAVLRAVDNDTSTLIGVTNVTATSEWRRYACVSQFTSTNVRYELEIVASGDAVFAAFAQLEREQVTPYQHQSGTLLDRAPASYYLANNGAYDPRAGRAEFIVHHDWDDTFALGDQYIFSTDTTGTLGTGGAGRFVLQVSDSNGQGGTGGAVDQPYNTDLLLYDAAGEVAAQIGNVNIDRRARVVYDVTWDAVRGEASVGQTGSTRSRTGPLVPTMWSAPRRDQIPRIYPGCRYTFDAAVGDGSGGELTQSTHLEGAIERLRIWRRP